MCIKQIKLTCSDCFKPSLRRLANFNINDDYECYADSYVRAFWGLCGLQKSEHEFITHFNSKVLTEQPLPQDSKNQPK